MEWVETTGRTIADAIDSALDELGVHEEDVEHEVIEEPRAGLFGRFGGSEARVRVRLKPISREKPGDRRRRKAKGRSRGEGNGRGDGGSGGGPRSGGRGSGGRGGSNRGRGGSGTRESADAKAGAAKPASAKADQPAGAQSGESKSKGGGDGRRGRTGDGAAKGNDMEEMTVPVERQAETAVEFTAGLVEAFGAHASVSDEIDDDAITVRIDGADLGLLVGPKGATLNAIEELVRAVVQRETGGHGARIHVDVAGYRAKRRTALEAFTRQLAAKVLETGQEQALEAMAAPDRKVVHDTVAEIDGVETSSEGEDPRRYVVIRQA
jgi:spoIIIJ-associated protein